MLYHEDFPVLFRNMSVGIVAPEPDQAGVVCIGSVNMEDMGENDRVRS